MTAEVVRKTDRSIPVDLGGEIIDNDCPLDGVIDSASFADTGMGGGRADQMNVIWSAVLTDCSPRQGQSP
jgi:hypothetical protein